MEKQEYISALSCVKCDHLFLHIFNHTFFQSAENFEFTSLFWFTSIAQILRDLAGKALSLFIVAMVKQRFNSLSSDAL